MVKALTLTQPWASLVALGHKQIETRSWSTKYRGELYIHAAKGYPRTAREITHWEQIAGRMPEGELPLGVILAKVQLVDVKRTEDVAPDLLEMRYGDYTPGRYAWMLEDIEPLPEPIPWKGQLGLFNIEL